jgi:DNA-binding transcriptional LysR family regulator
VHFQVTLVNSLNPRLEFPELRERKLDVVLARVVETFGEFEYAEDLDVENLLDDHLLVVAGVKSPWASRRKINLAELADAPWILPANSWNWLRVEEAFRAIGTNMPRSIMDTFSVALRQQLLATGRFVAAIPASTLRANIQEGILKVLPVALPNKPWPVAMVTLKNRTLSPAVQQFIELARISARAPAQTRKSKAF